MKLTFLLTALISVLSVTQIHAITRCSDFIQKYYTCKFLHNSSSISNNYYMSSTNQNKPTLSNSFYKWILKPVRTFKQAMDFFRSINSELSNCTNLDWCQCARNYSVSQPRELYDPFYFFQPFIDNSTFYPQIVKLIKTIKQENAFVNDSDILLTHYRQSINSPVLSQFCLRNDFNPEFVDLYEETRRCPHVNTTANDIQDNFKTCMISYLSGVGDREIYKLWTKPTFKNFSRTDLEKMTRCLIHVNFNLTTCNLDITRYLTLAIIWRFPQIITGNNLTAYIDTHLIDGVKSTPPLLDRVKTNIPMYSSMKTFKVESLNCKNFDFVANCFESPNLKIQCKGSKSLTISFIDSVVNKQVVYALDGYSMPRESVIKRTPLTPEGKDEKWLEIFQNPVDSDMMVILDYITNSTLEITQVKQKKFIMLIVKIKRNFTNFIK